MLAPLLLTVALAAQAQQKAAEILAHEWFKARPATAFEDWDPKKKAELLVKAKAIGPLSAPQAKSLREILWKIARKYGPRLEAGSELPTKWGEAAFTVVNAGPGRGLLLGLHGGGPGSGDRSEAASHWGSSLGKTKLIGVFPQAIRLEHDAWNTVEGERFLLTLIEMAKRTYDIDPDRVYCAGFSMGGTGSFFLAGRHPHLLAGALPFHGVIFAEKEGEEIRRLHHGLLPNVRHVPLYYTTGSEDGNCPPESYVFAEKVLDRLRQEHGGGYEVNFRCVPGLAHAFPPGEPQKGLDWMLPRRRVALPRALTWEATTDPFPQGEGRIGVRDFYWLRCEEPSDGMKVEAEIRGQEIELTIEKHPPQGFTVFLSPEMLDPAQEVRLVVNGERRFQGLLQPSVSCLLETLSARLDRRMAFEYRIDF